MEVVPFEGGRRGNAVLVLPAAIALVVLGLVMLFVIPWFGIPAGIVGVVLFVVWALGAGRRATGPQEAPKG